MASKKAGGAKKAARRATPSPVRQFVRASGVAKDIDELTPDEVEGLKAQLWSPVRPAAVPGREFALAPSKPAIVAEGDSWFDYPPGLDILDNLRTLGYPIASLAHFGDTLENMTYGTEVDRNSNPKPPQMNATVGLVQRNQPKFFLFSGGGNDVAGEELESYLDHKRSPSPGLRQAYVSYVFGTVVKAQYQFMIDQVKAAKPDIHIVIHGYAYPIPDGRPVVSLPFGFHWGGPWLKPSLSAKGFTMLTEGKALMRSLVDTFNTTLATVAAANANVHYVDLRPLVGANDWVNELHLRNSAYERVAAAFDQVMSAVP